MIKAGKFRVVFDAHSNSSRKGLTWIIASEPDLCQGDLTRPVASEPEFCRLKHKERGEIRQGSIDSSAPRTYK